MSDSKLVHYLKYKRCTYFGIERIRAFLICYKYYVSDFDSFCFINFYEISVRDQRTLAVTSGGLFN